MRPGLRFSPAIEGEGKPQMRFGPGRKTKAIEESVEPWEVRRKRELLVEIKNLDLALASITRDLGEERRKSGLGFYAEMPTSMKSPRRLALQLGLNELPRLHSATLTVLANRQ